MITDGDGRVLGGKCRAYNCKRVILWASVVLWMTLIFWFSSAGHDVSSGQSESVVHTVRDTVGVTLPEYLVRKMAHISAYFVLGILLFNLLREYKLSKKRLILASIAIAILYAITDELHQLFVPGRSGEIGDVLIDSTAAIIVSREPFSR